MGPDRTYPPIGVFDSGVGGLSILREMRGLLPDISVVYLADQAFAPYGDRSLAEVRERCEAITAYLFGYDVQTVVVACNSASAAALHHLRGLYPDLPFVGMEPAVKPAAASSDNRVVGVLATSATFQGELYASVVDRYAADVRIVEVAAVGLVQAIEDGDSAAIESIVTEHVVSLVASGADAIVLGCTHYPLVIDVIAAAAPGVRLVDPSPAVAQQVARVIESDVGSGTTTYLTTGNPSHFDSRAKELVDIDAGSVYLPSLWEGWRDQRSSRGGSGERGERGEP